MMDMHRDSVSHRWTFGLYVSTADNANGREVKVSCVASAFVYKRMRTLYFMTVPKDAALFQCRTNFTLPLRYS